jgi:uncharacterized membrane protein
MQLVKTIIVTTLVFLSMDAIWLGYLGKQLYLSQMGTFLRLNNGAIQANYFAAAIVYLALIAGIIFFVLPKAQGNVAAALGWGALFGFVCYATYDFTNLAIVKSWPLWLSIIDVIWGCVICGVTSAVTTWLK